MSEERQPRQAAELIRQTNHDTLSLDYPTPDTYHDLGSIADLVARSAQLLDQIGKATAHKAESGMLRHDNDSRSISDAERQAHTMTSAAAIVSSLKLASAGLESIHGYIQDAHSELSHLADLNPS